MFRAGDGEGNRGGQAIKGKILKSKIGKQHTPRTQIFLRRTEGEIST